MSRPSNCPSPEPLSLPGLHEAVARRLGQVLPPSARVLDAAAGTGVLTAQLREAGYEVSANDLNPEQWSVPGPAPSRVDLNGPFADSLAPAGPLDAMLAVEIIEHLENPRQFLREALRLVRPGGWAIVTTPNVLSAPARMLWLLRGRTVFFSPEQAGALGHVTILPAWLLTEHARSAGWEVVDVTYAGHYGRLGVLRSLLAALVAWCGRYDCFEQRALGCTLMTLRRPADREPIL